MSDEKWTPAELGADECLDRFRRYAEFKRSLFGRIAADLEERLFADLKPCPCNNQHTLGTDGEWRCSFCEKLIPLSPAERMLRNARAAEATDPRHRWCAKHDEPLWDEGGGPGAFSVCPRCYEGK